MNGGMQQLDGLVRTTRGAAASSLLTGLVAYWKLDEASGTRVDSSGRGNSLAPTNTPGSTTGKVGDAVLLVGASSQQLSIASNADVQIATDKTVCFWTYINSYTGAYPGVLGKFNGSPNDEWGFVAGRDEPNFWFVVSPDGTAQAAAGLGAKPSTGAWHFIAGWYDDTANTVNIQMDGGTVFSAACSGAHTGSNAFSIGRPDVRTSDYWDGRVDEVGIWDRVLTSGERAALYNGGSGSTYPFDGSLSGGATLVLNEHFSSTLNTAIWSTTPPFNANGAGAAGPTELQAYQAGSVTVTGGNLVLTAADVTGAPVLSKNYTSGLVHTQGVFSFQYGRVEIRAKVPSGQGFWPAFWMLPADDVGDTVYLPEIDIMETVNTMNPLYMTYHYDNGGLTSNQTTYATDVADGSFHTFALEWTQTDIRWYFDDTQRKQFSTSAFVSTVPMYLLINFAIGGSWPGSPDGTTTFPAELLIDYVKVWEY